MFSYQTAVYAFGKDLIDIQLVDQSNKIHASLIFTGLPEDCNVDKSVPGEINITLMETYLATKLIKNLDIILNDNIKWKQYSDKLVITLKHKGISNLANVYKVKKANQLVVDIPKTADAVATEEKAEPKYTTGVKALPPKKRAVPISRSISELRTTLPQYIANNKSNPNNQILHRQIFPGISHIQIRRIAESGPLFINVMDIAPGNPLIEVLPALANERSFGKKTVKTIVKEKNAIAGINAGFFKPATGHPLGTIIISDELISGPIYDRVTLGITRNNEYRVERIHLTGQLISESGKVLTIDNVNQPRISASHYLLYSYRWGWRTPESPKGSKQIALSNGKIAAISADPLPVPKNGYVIVGPDSGLFSTLHVGDRLKLIVSTDPDWSDVKHAIGGGPYLVKKGQVYIDKDAQQFSLQNIRAPRTAVGVTKDDHLLLVTVDGRQKDISVGVTFYQLAELMIELGAVNAMNLDGGSSTQMCIKDNVVSSPTVSGGNNISNSLIIVPIDANSGLTFTQ